MNGGDESRCECLRVATARTAVRTVVAAPTRDPCGCVVCLLLPGIVCDPRLLLQPLYVALVERFVLDAARSGKAWALLFPVTRNDTYSRM